MKRNLGMTLVELMIVVVIITILAALATVSYTRYIRRAKTSEAITFLQQIRMRQESYFQSYGVYANIPDYYPTTVTSEPTEWSPAGEVLAAWETLGARPAARHVYFQYRTVSGRPGDTHGDAADAGLETTRHWWYAQAQGDLDGDGTTSFFEITSQREEVFMENELE